MINNGALPEKDFKEAILQEMQDYLSNELGARYAFIARSKCSQLILMNTASIYFFSIRLCAALLQSTFDLENLKTKTSIILKIIWIDTFFDGLKKMK